MEPLNQDLNYRNISKQGIDEQEIVREILVNLLPTCTSDVLKYSPASGYFFDSKYEFKSNLYNISYIRALLDNCGIIKERMIKINEFNRENANLKAKFFPVAPIVSVSTNFYNELINEIEQKVHTTRSMEEVTIIIDNWVSKVSKIYEFLMPLFHPIPSYHDVEKAWSTFFKIHVSYTNPETELPFIRELQSALINLLPYYLDILCNRSLDIARKGSDVIITSHDSDDRCQMVHFTMFWSDKLVHLFKRAIRNRGRVEMGLSTLSEIKPWSYFIKEELSKISNDNLLRLKAHQFSKLLEDSCDLYGRQFSTLIFSELQKNDLPSWLAEIKAIFLLEIFSEEISHFADLEFTDSPRSTRLAALTKCLDRIRSSGNTARRFKLLWTDDLDHIRFKVVPKPSWPINTVFHNSFFDQLNKSLKLLTLLQYCSSLCVTMSVHFILRPDPLTHDIALVRRKMFLISIIKKLLQELRDMTLHFFSLIMENAFNHISRARDLETLEDAVKKWEWNLGVGLHDKYATLGVSGLYMLSNELYEEIEQPVTRFNVSQLERKLNRSLKMLEPAVEDIDQLDPNSIEYCFYSITNYYLPIVNAKLTY